MGIYYRWANDDKIIINIYVEYPWTWQQYDEVTKPLMQTISDMKYPCATVVDVTKYGSLSKDGNALHALLGMEKLMPENLFATAVVGAPYAVMVFMNILMKLRPRMKRITIFTQTMDEAYEKILEQRTNVEK